MWFLGWWGARLLDFLAMEMTEFCLCAPSNRDAMLLLPSRRSMQHKGARMKYHVHSGRLCA